MLSPTQQSCALIAAHTVLFAAGGCACGLLAKRLGVFDKHSKKKEGYLSGYLISVLLPAAACAAIAWKILPSHGKIWSSACLCDSKTPGAGKYIIESVDKFGRLLATRTVHALSSDLFQKYFTNEKFYSNCSLYFGLAAYTLSPIATFVTSRP